MEIRRFWRPDERLVVGVSEDSTGPPDRRVASVRTYARAAELKKKSELVAELAKLFTDAAEGRLEDAKLAARLNAWLPSNLREEPKPEPVEQASAA